MSTKNPYRLGHQVVPSAYRIHLTPDLDAATFAGRVEIDIDVKESVNAITLHAIELDLQPATFVAGNQTVESTSVTSDETYQTATFHFPSALPVGPAVLSIAFQGILNDQLHGFYRSTYTDDAGTQHVIATTQFEHSDARRAFPCWDEPVFKATYQVNLTVPSHLKAYSNSPVASSTDIGNGLTTHAYKPTMKMSTYLVAFVVGPFEETAPLDVDGVPLRILFPKGKEHMTALALDSGAHALRFFSEYFDIPYPGEKLDMIAIPDFAFGAMENLGLVTYRETALLVDPDTASLAERQRIVEVVSHEIAHMWFGDLVTMEWWEGIWLNEAFATFMAYMCTDHYRPEWKLLVDVGIYRDMALQVDGLHSTRPIEYEVLSPNDTQGMFDLLTYEKGGSVLRMLELFLGVETFRAGIRAYLRKHAYANTITTDLWDALEAASGQPVREVANSFILQGGHPLVTLENGTISQRPFMYGPAKGASAIGTTWTVPVTTRSLTSGQWTKHLLGAAPLSVTDEAPVVVNAGGSGVFRSRYGSGELAALMPRMADLDELERATLLADSWASLYAGMITWSDFLTVARGLGSQPEPTPWNFVAQATGMVHRALPESQRGALRQQIRELATPHFERLGWDKTTGENELVGQVRSHVIGLLGLICKDEAIRAEAVRRFEANALDGDLAATILAIVADQNRPGDYEKFLERYRTAPTPQDEQRYLTSLSGFSDERIGLDAAEKCFSEFRNQDGPIILGMLTTNEISGPTVWEYLTSRWADLDKFPIQLHIRTMVGLPRFITDPEFSARVEKFHVEHPLPGDLKTAQQFLERMHIGLDFTPRIRSEFATS
jgi:puromycin-sensitive aminopeptidase